MEIRIGTSNREINKKYGYHSIAAGIGIGLITSEGGIASHYVGGVITTLASYSAIDKAINGKK